MIYKSLQFLFWHDGPNSFPNPNQMPPVQIVFLSLIVDWFGMQIVQPIHFESEDIIGFRLCFQGLPLHRRHQMLTVSKSPYLFPTHFLISMPIKNFQWMLAGALKDGLFPENRRRLYSKQISFHSYSCGPRPDTSLPRADSSPDAGGAGEKNASIGC